MTARSVSRELARTVAAMLVVAAVASALVFGLIVVLYDHGEPPGRPVIHLRAPR